MLTELHLKNFKAWRDTKPIRLAPLTVLFGTNSSGKTSISQALLMLKQTSQSPDRRQVLHLGDPTMYEELPACGAEPSDRKFVAVAAVHPERPPILQAFDSKWWGWARALEREGIQVKFLCPELIAKKYEQKMGHKRKRG